MLRFTTLSCRRIQFLCIMKGAKSMVAIVKRSTTFLLSTLMVISFLWFLLPHVVVADGPSLYAVVNTDGSLVRGANVSKAAHLGTGRYEITFNQDVSRCAYTATIGDPGNKLVYYPGLIYTAGGHGSRQGVYVETKNTGGGLGDWPFHLNVSCQALYAVVNTDGSLVRGANVSKVAHLGTGRYEVTFNQDVSRCAYTATIGDPGNALVYYPGLIYTAGGHGSRQGVYVETKNTGGGLGDWPFHLNVSC
jgi:hypothetical protein